MKGAWKTAAIMLFLLLAAHQALGLGLSYDYLDNNTLKLAPGESNFYKLTLQNEEDKTIAVAIELDSTIATLVGDPAITLEPKTYDNFVYFNVTAPSSAEPGTEYTIRYIISPKSDAKGQVPFNVKYDRSFKALVSASQQSTTQIPGDIGQVQRHHLFNSTEMTILLVLFIAALLVLVWKKSKGLSKRFIKKPATKEASTPKQPPVEAIPEARQTIETVTIRPEKEQSATTNTPALTDTAKASPTPSQPEAIAPPEKIFRLHDGKEMRSLSDLRQALAQMERETFTHHVNEQRNDFSIWVDDALELHSTAAKLAGVRSIEAMKEILDNEIA